MTDDHLLRELHDLALAIAPELSGSPLYVLNQPGELPAPKDTRGYHVGGPCAPMQQYLKGKGDWRGPGPAIVFVTPDLTREEAVVLFLHELAHALPYSPPLPVVAITDDALGAGRDALQAWCDDPEPDDASRPQWIVGNHHQNFHRIALHLWWRAALLGEVVPFDGLCGGRHYDLSPPYMYWRAIGNEPIKMQHATFAEILASDPPKLFRDLWYENLAYWMSHHPDAVKGVAACRS